MSDIPNKPPSPELLAVVSWFAQNAWVTGMAIIFALGRAVFGDVKKDIAEIKQRSEARDTKLDAIADSLNELARVVYEMRGEMKHKERSTK